jgi:hypothetical protein
MFTINCRSKIMRIGQSNFKPKLATKLGHNNISPPLSESATNTTLGPSIAKSDLVSGGNGFAFICVFGGLGRVLSLS